MDVHYLGGGGVLSEKMPAAVAAKPFKIQTVGAHIRLAKRTTDASTAVLALMVTTCRCCVQLRGPFLSTLKNLRYCGGVGKIVIVGRLRIPLCQFRSVVNKPGDFTTT